MSYHGAAEALDALARWARIQPGTTAWEADDGSRSFSQSEADVDAASAALARVGVRAGVRVGIAYGRSWATMPAVLAVWRLGGAVVMLDRELPAARLAAIVDDAAVGVVVGPSADVAENLPWVDVRTSCTDVRPACHSAGRTLPSHPQAAAYLTYTSGTSGEPKGVEVPFGALDAFLLAVRTLCLPAGAVGLNPVSPAYDGWLWCSLVHLLHGLTTVIADLQRLSLDEVVAMHRPQMVNVTPSLLATGQGLDGVDVLVVAGEACPPGLLAAHAGRRRILNVYGPTETTIAATWADSARGDDVGTIGTAAPGYAASVVDGELCVRGPGVATGYRNRPAQTAAAFVPDPDGPPGARMYRTGDAVRLRSDGHLEYVGRLDRQLKVRGYRVEPDGVEHLAVRIEGVVAAACAELGGQRLGLAVVASPGADATAVVEHVRAACAEHLPPFMVPSQVSALDALPTAASGKVDRTALAAAICRAAEPCAEGVPVTQREAQVLDAFAMVLPSPPGDTDTSFFDAGGHSLLAARVVSTLRHLTGLPLTLRHLLAGPSVRALAAQLDALEAATRAGAR